MEEIYTAHLIRITLNRESFSKNTFKTTEWISSSQGPDAPTSLARGKVEGWTRIRVSGQTDWKRAWMVVHAGQRDTTIISPQSTTDASPPPTQRPKKRRISNIFSHEQNSQPPVGPLQPIINVYAGPKPKERKKVLLSLTNVTQAFAVYPERPELISRSTLIKVEGLLGGEEMAQSMKSREGWILVMPEIESASGNQAMELLKWIIGEF